jgi:sulfonate transport system ATP-binding protein
LFTLASGVQEVVTGTAVLTPSEVLPGFEGELGGDAPTGAPVTARGLVKRFGDNIVLNALDLHAPAGHFLAIVGRSGCGKSTLLRLLAGLDGADGGRIFFGDREVDAAPRPARVMFQEARLLPRASVLANVEVGLGRERGSATGRRRAREALASVGLADRADDWPSALSGGQKQRVALARALVGRPRFLALDEPLGALDALTRIEMQQLLETAWRRERFTAILVTHDVAEAVALAGRIVLLEDGAVALDVAINLPRPRSRGAAEFGTIVDRILGRLLRTG